MKKTIFFDIGHVVVRFHLTELYQVFAEQAGIPVQQLLQYRKSNIHRMTLGESNADDFFNAMRELAGDPAQNTGTLKEIWLAQGMRLKEINTELLNWIDANRGTVQMAILSNLTPSRMLLDEKMGIYSHFDFCLLSCLEGLKKPDQQFYKLALLKAGVNAEHAAFVDDNPLFIEAAEQLGIKTFLFNDRSETSRLIEMLQQFIAY